MQYFVVMIDYGRRGREAVVDREITRREVISRIASGEYQNISFIHEIVENAVEDVTEAILTEAALPQIPPEDVDLQAIRLDHPRPTQARTDVTQAWSLRHRPVRHYTKRTVDPVVLRAARSACALAASFSG